MEPGLEGQEGFWELGPQKGTPGQRPAQAKASSWCADCRASGPGGGAGSGAVGSLGSWRGRTEDRAAKAGEALIIYFKNKIHIQNRYYDKIKYPV